MNKLSPMKNKKSVSSVLQVQHDLIATLRKQDKREYKATLKQKRKAKHDQRFEAWSD